MKRLVIGTVVAGVLGCGLVSEVHGQCPEAMAKLLALDGAEDDLFGTGVSVSGEVAVIGAPDLQLARLDELRVFRRGADDDNGNMPGSAYVYRFNGSTWIEEAKLLASDGADNDGFGVSVSVDGDVVVVGAGEDDNSGGSAAGAAYVYRFNGATWIEEAKLLASDGEPGAVFGSSVSLSGDVAVVGAIESLRVNNNTGSAYVYRFNGSTWIEEAKLLASDGADFDRFGFSVSVDGDVAIVGAWNDSNAGGAGAGAAYVYRLNGSTWIEEGKLLASDGAASDEFGHSVSVCGDVAVVGAWHVDDNGTDTGAAYIYRFDSVTWIEEARLVAYTGPGGGFFERFGSSVSVSGEVAIVGASGEEENDNNSGSAHVFRYNGSTWIEGPRLFASDGAFDDEFGASVSISGDMVVIGAWQDDDNGGESGSAYVFDLGVPCEKIWPDDPDDFFTQFGGPVTGDALDLCDWDNVRLEVLQTAQLSPLLPYIRLEYWAHSSLVNSAVVRVEYFIEAHVSANVSGGQNDDTLRTSIRNYTTGLFESVDVRGTSAFNDSVINHVQTTDAPDYVNAGDGEVRVRHDVFDPGITFSPNWSLKVDLYEVVLNE